MNFSKKELAVILSNQKDEINAYNIYSRLSKNIKDKKNSEILNNIAINEKNHYEIIGGS